LVRPSSDLVLRGIFGLSSEAFIVTDERLRILMFSAGAETIFGYGEDEVLGAKIDLLIPARFHGVHSEKVRRFSAGQPDSLVMGARSDIIGLREKWRRAAR
jgi:PAS domain S-box-containing protein